MELQGKPVTGPLRTVVLDRAGPAAPGERAPIQPAATWNLSLNLKDIAFVFMTGVRHQSVLVSDSADASKLHELRALFEKGTWSQATSSLPVADPDQDVPAGRWRYNLLMYDVSPVDDEEGRVNLTW